MSHPAVASATDGLIADANSLGLPPVGAAGSVPIAAAAAAQQPAQRLNPTGRDIPMGGPLVDNGFVLGDLSYTLTTDDRILVDTKMLLPMLRGVLTTDALATLSAAIGDRYNISTTELGDLGVRLFYDPSNFGCGWILPPNCDRAR